MVPPISDEKHWLLGLHPDPAEAREGGKFCRKVHVPRQIRKIVGQKMEKLV